MELPYRTGLRRVPHTPEQKWCSVAYSVSNGQAGAVVIGRDQHSHRGQLVATMLLPALVAADLLAELEQVNENLTAEERAAAIWKMLDERWHRPTFRKYR